MKHWHQIQSDDGTLNLGMFQSWINALMAELMTHYTMVAEPFAEEPNQRLQEHVLTRYRAEAFFRSHGLRGFRVEQVTGDPGRISLVPV